MLAAAMCVTLMSAADEQLDELPVQEEDQKISDLAIKIPPNALDDGPPPLHAQKRASRVIMDDEPLSRAVPEDVDGTFEMVGNFGTDDNTPTDVFPFHDLDALATSMNTRHRLGNGKEKETRDIIRRQRYGRIRNKVGRRTRQANERCRKQKTKSCPDGFKNAKKRREIYHTQRAQVMTLFYGADREKAWKQQHVKEKQAKKQVQKKRKAEVKAGKLRKPKLSMTMIMKGISDDHLRSSSLLQKAFRKSISKMVGCRAEDVQIADVGGTPVGQNPNIRSANVTQNTSSKVLEELVLPGFLRDENSPDAALTTRENRVVTTPTGEVWVLEQPRDANVDLTEVTEDDSTTDEDRTEELASSESESSVQFYVKTNNANIGITTKALNAVAVAPAVTGLDDAFHHEAYNVGEATSVKMEPASSPKLIYGPGSTKAVAVPASSKVIKPPPPPPPAKKVAVPPPPPPPPVVRPAVEVPKKVISCPQPQVGKRECEAVKGCAYTARAASDAEKKEGAQVLSARGMQYVNGFVISCAFPPKKGEDYTWVIWLFVVIGVIIILIVLVHLLMGWYQSWSQQREESQLDKQASDEKQDILRREKQQLMEQGVQMKQAFHQVHAVRSAALPQVRRQLETLAAAANALEGRLRTANMELDASDMRNLSSELMSLASMPSTGPTVEELTELTDGELLGALGRNDHEALARAVAKADNELSMGEINQPPTLQRARQSLAAMERAAGRNYAGCRPMRNVEDKFRCRPTMDKEAAHHYDNSNLKSQLRYDPNPSRR